MAELSLFPFAEDACLLLRHCKVPLHTGAGTVDCHGDPTDPFTRMFVKLRQQTGQAEAEHSEFAASFFVPVTGNCRILLRWSGDCQLSQNFGEQLTIAGDSPDGPFRFVAPQYYVHAVSEHGEQPGWAIASPVNRPATVSYGDSRPVATVTALINNLDFPSGNVPSASDSGRDNILRVVAAGRTVDFTWRSERRELRRLVDARLVPTTAFAMFSFEAWPEAPESDLVAFAHNVSSLCCYVFGQHTGTPVLSFLDRQGRIIRRVLGEPVESRFRSGCAFQVLHAEDGVPELFRQCFEEHCRMQQSDLWRQMPYFFASIEDPPYLEQKYATLMAAVELLIRSSLIENGHITAAEAESRTLPELIGAARGTLRWEVPKHYTEAERYRKTRNAVDHGGQLPHDARQVRADFDKWNLFLRRRVFMRLGFGGHIKSPQGGWVSSSPVNEFSEGHNSFGNK